MFPLGPEHLVFMIPIVAIVLAMGNKMLNRILEHRERMINSHRIQAQPPNSEVSRQLEELRQQMIALRDTTTQYDMSIDQTLRRLEQRVEFLEQQNISQYTTTKDEKSNTIINGG